MNFEMQKVPDENGVMHEQNVKPDSLLVRKAPKVDGKDAESNSNNNANPGSSQAANTSQS
jgi:hypothetical protein